VRNTGSGQEPGNDHAQITGADGDAKATKEEKGERLAEAGQRDEDARHSPARTGNVDRDTAPVKFRVPRLEKEDVAG